MQLVNEPILEDKPSAAAKAFDKQSEHFDADDLANPILQAWREQIYRHVGQHLQPGDHILELNAGTGIDALHFAGQGFRIHATDIAAGMVREISWKIEKHGKPGFTCQQLSFDRLSEVNAGPFDYVFSNFGGLNCTADLSRVAQGLTTLLNPGARITWVVMPPVCPWEWLWLMKGNAREAFRRFRTGGTTAHLEGEYFKTYYHSVSAISRALGNTYKLVSSEGLGVFSAPPASLNFYARYPKLYQWLRTADLACNTYYPFNRCGDHVIATFEKLI